MSPVLGSGVSAHGRLFRSEDNRDAVPVGKVRLLASADRWAPTVTDEIDLREGPDLRVRLRRGGEVRGVIRVSGRPVAKAKVRVYHHEWFASSWSSTNEKGEFRIYDRVGAGRRRLEVKLPGHNPVFRTIHVVDDETLTLTLDM